MQHEAYKSIFVFALYLLSRCYMCEIHNETLLTRVEAIEADAGVTHFTCTVEYRSIPQLNRRRCLLCDFGT